MEPTTEEPVEIEYTPHEKAKAGELYELYCAEVGGVAWNKDPLPSWAEFIRDDAKTLQANAWCAIARRALSWAENCLQFAASLSELEKADLGSEGAQPRVTIIAEPSDT